MRRNAGLGWRPYELLAGEGDPTVHPRERSLGARDSEHKHHGSNSERNPYRDTVLAWRSDGDTDPSFGPHGPTPIVRLTLRIRQKAISPLAFETSRRRAPTRDRRPRQCFVCGRAAPASSLLMSSRWRTVRLHSWRSSVALATGVFAETPVGSLCRDACVPRKGAVCAGRTLC